MKNSTIAIILAAGDGADMNSSLPKVMHKISGVPMVQYLFEGVKGVTDNRPLLILDHKFGEPEDISGWEVDTALHEGSVKDGFIPRINWEILREKAEYGLILSGNLPLIRSESLKRLLNLCQEGTYDGAYISSSREGEALAFSFRVKPFLSILEKLGTEGMDYTWRNLLNLMEDRGRGLGIYSVEDPIEIMAVNTRLDQAKAQKEMTLRINYRHLEAGVTLIDPYNTYIGPYVKIQRDVMIYPGNHLEGNVIVGEGSLLYPNNRIVDSTLGRGTQIQSSVILESHVDDMASIGPFAYLRPGSKIGRGARIGDFVEVKNTEIGEGTKVSHLSYVGDAKIGKGVNIGGGVIFVNYDGQKKYRTDIEDNAFIGCNVNLIAPVKVGKNGYIAAGSTITDEVPGGALSIARARQINKEDWVKKHKDGWIRKHKNETEENQ